MARLRGSAGLKRNSSTRWLAFQSSSETHWAFHLQPRISSKSVCKSSKRTGCLWRTWKYGCTVQHLPINKSSSQKMIWPCKSANHSATLKTWLTKLLEVFLPAKKKATHSPTTPDPTSWTKKIIMNEKATKARKIKLTIRKTIQKEFQLSLYPSISLRPTTTYWWSRLTLSDSFTRSSKSSESLNPNPRIWLGSWEPRYSNESEASNLSAATTSKPATRPNWACTTT